MNVQEYEVECKRNERAEFKYLCRSKYFWDQLDKKWMVPWTVKASVKEIGLSDEEALSLIELTTQEQGNCEKRILRHLRKICDYDLYAFWCFDRDGFFNLGIYLDIK